MLYVNRRVVFSLFLLLFFSRSAFAHHIEVSQAWVPEAAPVAKVMAAYMDISNHSKQGSYITAIRSPQFKKVEIHSMTHENGMMHMEKQERLEIPAGKTFSLQPGGYHVMLFNPKQWYQAGSTISLFITLDNTSTFKVEAPVRKETGGDTGMHHH